MRPTRIKANAPEAGKSKELFSGREALLDGIFSPASARDAERQILASAVVRESVMQLVEAVRNKNAFEQRVVELAGGIVRRKERPQGAGHDAEGRDAAPSNMAEALLAALARMGIEGEIVDERKGASATMFTVGYGGQMDKVVLSNNIMDFDDPVSKAETIARACAVGRAREDARAERLRERRASRPPAAPLGVGEEELDRRKITYDGQVFGVAPMFTYMVEGMETSITAPPELKGKTLLDFLEARIFEFHIKSGKPFEALFIEDGASNVHSTPAIEAIGDEKVRRAAKALFHMACDERIFTEHVPEEYLAAFIELRNGRAFSDFIDVRRNGLFSPDELQEFRGAFERVDHPGHKMVRALHRGMQADGGKLSDEDRDVLLRTLEMYADADGEVCERALRNLSGAYAMLAQAPGVESWDVGKLKSMHFEMAFTIRKAVEGLNSALFA